MLVNRSFDRLAAGCLPRVSSDGYDAYTKPLSEQVRAVRVYPLWWALTKGKPGRPPQPTTIPDPALVYGQVVKEREGRKIVKVEKRLVLGPPSTDLSFISTSLLERQNGTARSRNRYLLRTSLSSTDFRAATLPDLPMASGTFLRARCSPSRGAFHARRAPRWLSSGRRGRSAVADVVA
jgi:hypothetical protein